jgi:beta-phosphoglucomutase
MLKTHPCGFRGIAFDFDGTLVDTLHLHYEAYRQVFDFMGLTLSEEQFLSNIGGKATEAIPLFLAGRRASLAVEEIHQRKKMVVADLFLDAPLHVLPAANFLPLLAGRLPLALVSSGSRPGIEQLLNRLGWFDYFKVIVTGEDTTLSKPSPMPYLLAAEKLGLDPADIAAFEDTVAGIESAKSAGMSVFDVSANNSTLRQP